MTWSVLLGVEDPGVAAGFRALLEESGQFQLVEIAPTATQVAESVARRPVDVILVHEQIGPLPALDLIHELATRMPEVATVLLVRDGSADAYGAAMLAGARGIVTIPPTLEELEARLAAAAQWSQSVRRRLDDETAETEPGFGGTMIAVAGAKGGTGTTTLAAYLALMAAGTGAQRTCLVDLDLQTGDVPNLLNVVHRRSVHDLVDVARDISARNLDETMYAHPSGLRILLAPADGEWADDVTADAARSILGAIRAHFELVIVDCGAVVAEASAVAVSLADQVLVTATPDVPSLRAVKRLGQLWERLEVRKETDFTVVLNRTSRRSEVQPDFARKVTGAPLARTVLPAAFGEVEKALNTGDPEQLKQGKLRKALYQLGSELQVVRPAGASRRWGRAHGQAGATTLEAVGLVPVLIFLALIAWQLTLLGLTYSYAVHAANEGARQAAVGGAVAPACADLPDAWEDTCAVAVVGGEVVVTLSVPPVAGGVGIPLDATATAAFVPEGP